MELDPLHYYKKSLSDPESQKKYAENWDSIFNKKENEETKDQQNN